MRFQALETLPTLKVAQRQGLFPAWLLTSAAGLIALLTTIAVNTGPDHPFIIWPINGITIALALPHAPYRRINRLVIYAAAVAGVFAGVLVSGAPSRYAAVIGSLTALDLVGAGLFLSPHVRSFDDLKKRQNVLRLVLASTLTPLLTGSVAALLLGSSLKGPSLVVIPALANALGIALFTPATLFVTTGEDILRRTFPAKPLPILLSCALFIAVCVGTFWQNSGPYLFLIFPALMILLLSTGLEGALFSSMLIIVVGSYATAHGHGPIWLMRNASPAQRMMALQVFVLVSSFTALPIAAVSEERRKAVHTATTSNALQRAILGHTREAIILSTLDGSERYASAAIEQITGWTPSEYIGLDRLQTVHPDDRARVSELLGNLENGVRNTSLRYRILHKDGSWSWVEASVSVYGDEQIAGYVGTVRDIARLIETEQGWIQDRRVRSEEQSRFAEAAVAAKLQISLRDEFLSNVSHELRSPLTSIYSFSSIIADGLAGETTPEQNQYLGIVLKNVIQLQSMIEDLLTVTQSREGKLNIELQAVCLAETIADAADTVCGFANRKRIVLTVDPVDDSLFVYADPTRVRQILIILLDNAVKFTPEGGTVTIAVSLQNPDTVLFRVSDTGCGIPEDKVDLIFHKLYQVGGPERHDTNANGRAGLGLGLHIARTLVVRQSGHIWVTSVPNTGSVFHFTLPTYREQDRAGRIDATMMQRADATMMHTAHETSAVAVESASTGPPCARPSAGRGSEQLAHIHSSPARNPDSLTR